MAIGIGEAVLAAIIAAYSQILLKEAADQEYDSFLKAYINVRVIIGYLLMVASTVLNIIAYMSIDYMLGNIIGAFSYVLVVIIAYFKFKEVFTFRKVIGISLILTGIVLYNL